MLTESGLVDSSGQPLVYNSTTREQALRQVKENSRAVVKPESPPMVPSSSAADNQISKDRQPTSNQSFTGTEEPASSENGGDSQGSVDTGIDIVNGEIFLDTTKVSLEDLSRLQKRYAGIKAGMRGQLDSVITFITQPKPSFSIVVGGKASSGASITANNDKTRRSAADPGAEQQTNKQNISLNAGELLYGVTQFEANTDFGSEVGVDVVNLPQGHPLFGSVIFGIFELKFDEMVLSFNRICAPKATCIAMNGIALNPVTASRGIASEVDHHYLHRLGGLFVSTLIYGASEAASETTQRTEDFTPTGTKVTTSGLSGKQLTYRAGGKVGERFADVFSENLNRPSTATLRANSEIAILLMDNITQ